MPTRNTGWVASSGEGEQRLPPTKSIHPLLVVLQQNRTCREKTC